MDQQRSKDFLMFEKGLSNEERRYLLRGITLAVHNILARLAKKDEKIFREVMADPVCEMGSQMAIFFMENDYKGFLKYKKAKDKIFDKVVFGE